VGKVLQVTGDIARFNFLQLAQERERLGACTKIAHLLEKTKGTEDADLDQIVLSYKLRTFFGSIEAYKLFYYISV